MDPYNIFDQQTLQRINDRAIRDAIQALEHDYEIVNGPDGKKANDYVRPSSLCLLSQVVRVHLPDVVETSRP